MLTTLDLTDPTARGGHARWYKGTSQNLGGGWLGQEHSDHARLTRRARSSHTAELITKLARPTWATRH